MNKSPVPAVVLAAGDVLEGEPAAVAVAVAQISGTAGVAPVVVDRVRALHHHVAVAALDVPPLRRSHAAPQADVGAVGTVGAEVLAVVGDVPGAVGVLPDGEDLVGAGVGGVVEGEVAASVGQVVVGVVDLDAEAADLAAVVAAGAADVLDVGPGVVGVVEEPAAR